MYRPSTAKRHDMFLASFIKTFNKAKPQTITAQKETKKYIRDGIITLGPKLIGFDFEVRDDWSRGRFPYSTLGQFERKFDPEKEIELSIQTSTDGRWFVVAWHSDFEIKKGVERKTNFHRKEKGIMRTTQRFAVFDFPTGLDKLKRYLLCKFPVCDYGDKDIPWANCLPCPLFKDGHCLSQGAAIYRTVRLKAESLLEQNR